MRDRSAWLILAAGILAAVLYLWWTRPAGGVSILEQQFAQAGIPTECVLMAMTTRVGPDRMVMYIYPWQGDYPEQPGIKKLLQLDLGDGVALTIDDACPGLRWFGQKPLVTFGQYPGSPENMVGWIGDARPMPTPTVTPAPTPTPGSIWWRPWPWRR